MNYRMIGQMLGRVLCMEAVLMLVPLFIALGYHESVVPFLISVVITGVVGFCLSRLQPKHSDFYAREGFVIVVMCWVVLSLLGTLPFVISGEIPRFIDALFETVSGFSTCGASILTDREALSYSCRFWRSFSPFNLVISMPLYMISPSSGVSRETRNRIKVDFPQPDSPTSPSVFPL